MASINRLAIRGVRSFSPNDEEQCVEFLVPFTVICGSNGCGKTTIIEALKYAITGSLPPGGAKAGQNFVHDPRTMDTTQVKAQVKLRFTSKASQTMVVVRSMEVNQKKTTATFKQLDGLLRSTDESGQRITLSHKCSELDKQMPQLLGVSPAILNHVLFCHQEDSSWPLAEASLLKKRFDEIFDSMRYTKAIALFKQTEKDMNAKVKDLYADVASLTSHQHAAHGFRKDLAAANESIEELDDDKKRIDDAVKELDEEIERLREIEMNVSRVESELDAAQQEKLGQMSLVQRLRSMLEENLTQQHSLRELEKMLRDYDAKVSDQQEEFQDLQAQDKAFDQAIASLRRDNLQLTQEKARLDADRETYETNCRERYQLMESIAQTYSVDLTQGGAGNISVNLSMDGASLAGSQSVAGGLSQGSILQITTDDMEAIMQSLEKKEEELKRLLQETSDRHQASEDKLLKELAELKASRSSIEAEREKLNNMRRDYNQELKELSSKTEGPVRVRKSDVEDIRRRVEKLVKQRDQANADPRREEIPTEIRRLEEKVDSIKRQIEDDRIALDGLRLCADAENQIAMLREQCTKDLELLEENFRDNSFSLGKYDLQPEGKLPSYDDDEGRDLVAYVESFVDKAQARYAKSKTASSKADEEVNKAQRTVNEMLATCASKQQSLQSTNTRTESLRTRVVARVESTINSIRKHEMEKGNECPGEGSPIQAFIDHLDDRLKDMDDDSPLDDADYSRRLLKKLRKLAKKKASDGTSEYRCPCCSRAMDDDDYVVFRDTMQELSTESSLVQVDENARDEHNDTKARYREWRKILADNASDCREYDRLQKESATSETEIKKLVDDIASQKTALSALTDKATESRNETEEIRELVDLCRRWAEDAHRIKDKRLQINQKNDELTVSATSGGRDLRTVERELQERVDSKEEKIQQINKLNKEMTEVNNRVAALATQTSQLENVLREKEAKYKESEKATERKNELLVGLQKAKEDEAQLQDQLVPIARRIEGKSREKERLRSGRENEVNERQTALLEFQSEMKDLRRLTSVIETFKASGKLQLLEDHGDKVKAVLDKIRAQQKEKDKLAPLLSEAAASVENQERYKKMLRENISLINEEEKIKTLQEKVERLEDEMGEIEGSENVSERLAQAEASKQKRLSEKARFEGRWIELVEVIRSLKRKLSTDEYKNVDEELRITNIKHSTTKMAAVDLKKYYTAVEQALLKYHTVKIAEINKIIQELWLLVYKGEDISSIEIESGHEAGSGAKKTYNYRVVMTKNNNRGVKIDMKGRCSAGQRVLACIVIRLALAETFGVQCGTLALDEPTVNLDYRNKKGLAIALAQIIASRSKQTNFQLIMITHDEEFVSMMKTELAAHSNFSMPEKFFRVHREMAAGGRYYSKITATDWEEIV